MGGKLQTALRMLYLCIVNNGRPLDSIPAFPKGEE